MEKNRSGIRAVARAALLALSIALAAALCPPTAALAYFTLDPVSIELGSTSVSMETNSTTSVALSVNPASEQQLPGCGMSICPEMCGGLANPSTGVVGGCLDDAGWCTCAGTTYYTAYTTVSVASSNPYVARASVSGNSLTITSGTAGTATLTIYASLSKHVDASATVTVTVTEPSGGSSSGGGSGSSGGSSSGGSSSSSDGSSGSDSSGSDDPSDPSGSDASSDAGSGTVVDPNSGTVSNPSYVAPALGDSGSGSASGETTVTEVDNAPSRYEVVTVTSTTGGDSSSVTSAGAGDAGSDATDRAALEAAVEVVESETGAETVVAPVGDAAWTAEILGRVAGTDNSATLWSGGTADAPSLSLTFAGSDLDPAADLAFDSTVAISRAGEGDVAALLNGDEDTIVMDFTYDGALPATATVAVRASGVFSDGKQLSLYYYNADEQRFDLAHDGIEVAGDYATYQIEHCSVWALSSNDLSLLAMPTDSGTVDASTVNVHSQDGTAVIAGIVGVAVVAAAVAAFLAIRRRHRGALIG